MKNKTVILAVLFLICGMVTLSSAQTATSLKKNEVRTEIVRGKIISINAVKNEILVKENKTGTEKTIVVTLKAISSLEVNDELEVALKVGSNVAESVRKIIKTTKESGKK
ncbi:MAG: hypothetical protein WCY09_04545 [Candidatus Omnitrophota bacterium]